MFHYSVTLRKCSPLASSRSIFYLLAVCAAVKHEDMRANLLNRPEADFHQRLWKPIHYRGSCKHTHTHMFKWSSEEAINTKPSALHPVIFPFPITRDSSVQRGAQLCLWMQRQQAPWGLDWEAAHFLWTSLFKKECGGEREKFKMRYGAKIECWQG